MKKLIVLLFYFGSEVKLRFVTCVTYVRQKQVFVPKIVLSKNSVSLKLLKKDSYLLWGGNLSFPVSIMTQSILRSLI